MVLSGRDIEWYVEHGLLKIDPVEKEQFQQNGVDLILESITSNRRHFEPLHFYLGATREILTLPNDLMGFVELRSTWGRRGILIPPTIVDAGFSGNLTVEIFSAACEFPVPLGERFLHLVFAKMSSPGMPYRGQFYGQRGITRS